MVELKSLFRNKRDDFHNLKKSTNIILIVLFFGIPAHALDCGYGGFTQHFDNLFNPTERTLNYSAAIGFMDKCVRRIGSDYKSSEPKMS
ncbi:MAG: hypothetical protein AAF203_03220, partial [Pseudomonadota bacterium]